VSIRQGAATMSDIKTERPFLAGAFTKPKQTAGATPHCRPPRQAVNGSLHWVGKPGQKPIAAKWVSGFWVAVGRTDWDAPLALASDRWRYLGAASPAPLQ
jgi:hypothetical protein